MRGLTCILVMVLAAGALGGGAKTDDLLKKHLAHYQGRWQCTGGNDFNGKPIPKAAAEKVTLTVEGTSFTMHDDANNMTIKGTFKLDPTKKPPAIDVMLEGSKDEPLRGIYEIVDDNTRRSCISVGGPRPEKFVNDPSYITIQWKRIAKKP